MFAGRRSLQFGPERNSLHSREVLFREGAESNAFVIVVGGVIAIRKQGADGSLMLLELAYPGRALDWGSLVPGSKYHATAVAPFQSEVCTTPANVVREAIRWGGNPALAMLQQATRELERTQDSLLRQVTVPCQQRLQYALLLLAQYHGEHQVDGSWLVELPVTRRDLASMVGMRPETMSRVLRTIEDANLAHFEGRHVLIPHLDALRDIPFTLLADDRRGLD
ncbi:MAG: Crp/Fnr family transcriptional regulator [Hyphomicrobium sp.]